MSYLQQLLVSGLDSYNQAIKKSVKPFLNCSYLESWLGKAYVVYKQETVHAYIGREPFDCLFPLHKKFCRFRF